MSGLHVERLMQEQAFDDLAPEWAALDARLSPRLPFTSPIWNALWWKHFHRNQLLFRDQVNLYAVRNAQGTLVAVAPMMLSFRPGVGPLRMRELQFLGADTNITELRGIACMPDDLLDVVAALERSMHQHRTEWDWVQWRGLRNSPETGVWQQHIAGLQPTGEILNYFLPLPSTWETFRSSLPRNIKESLRKCYNSLARDGHTFVFRAVARPEAIPDAVARFLILHAQRASLPGTVEHLNIFASQEGQSFLHEYAAEMAEQDAMRVFELVIGGQVVASRLAFVLGNELYLYFSGYDPAWGQYSVMTTVTAEALKWAIAHELKVANLSTGTDVSKTRWRPVNIGYAEGIVASPTARGPIVSKIMDRLRTRRQRRTQAAPTPPQPQP